MSGDARVRLSTYLLAQGHETSTTETTVEFHNGTPSQEILDLLDSLDENNIKLEQFYIDEDKKLTDKISAISSIKTDLRSANSIAALKDLVVKLAELQGFEID